MLRIKFKANNKKKITFLIGMLFFLFFTTILIPFWFINYLPFSGVWYFFMENIIYSIISGIILLYFILVGEYYYDISVDNYVIQVTSYRLVIDFFKEKDYVDIAHAMLVDYRIFNRSVSLNKTLMLKIKTDKGKKITKRFNLTLISKKEIRALTRALDIVIAKIN
jgi:hypothetical protein